MIRVVNSIVQYLNLTLICSACAFERVTCSPKELPLQVVECQTRTKETQKTQSSLDYLELVTFFQSISQGCPVEKKVGMNSHILS